MSEYKPGFDAMKRYLKPVELGLVENPMTPVSVRAVVKRLCNELARFDHALQSLTPGGSEFVNNPEACVRFVETYVRRA